LPVNQRFSLKINIIKPHVENNFGAIVVAVTL